MVSCTELYVVLYNNIYYHIGYYNQTFMFCALYHVDLFNVLWNSVTGYFKTGKISDRYKYDGMSKNLPYFHSHFLPATFPL